MPKPQKIYLKGKDPFVHPSRINYDLKHPTVATAINLEIQKKLLEICIKEKCTRSMYLKRLIVAAIEGRLIVTPPTKTPEQIKIEEMEAEIKRLKEGIL